MNMLKLFLNSCRKNLIFGMSYPFSYRRCLMKRAIFALAAVLMGACSSGGSGSACGSENSCVNDPNCQCWCSVKCGFRKKNDTDSPVYIKGDPNGKFCYCKQWDVDNYNVNCVQGMKMKEPASAQ